MKVAKQFVATQFKVIIDRERFIDRRDWVKYLTLNMYQFEILQKANPEILKVAPSEEFGKFVEEQVMAYLDGKAPQAEIASAVMNCADMYMSDNNITLHAGDYISLQNHFQRMK